MIRKEIKKLISGAISIPGVKLEITNSENKNFGHYSTNAAFELSKIWKMSPIEAGNKIKNAVLEKDTEGFFKKIEVANPGFINFWISEKYLGLEIKEILKKKNNYGRGKVNSGEKIQIEFISANPTGPLTMANGRGGFLGDVLSNVLEFSGLKIEREYYVNDTGNQIITLGKSIICASGLIPFEEKFYKGVYIKNWALKNKSFIVRNQKNPLVVGQRAARDLLLGIKKVIEKKSHIKFDRYTSEEGDIHKKNFIKKAKEIFESKNLTYKKDQATWLKTTNYGDDKDRVLVTGDGFPTYFLADSGHSLESLKREFKNKILILGPDHYGYVARIKAVAEILDFSDFKTIITQAVRVVKEGKEVKMSKRKGEFITFEEVVDEVGPDAARFFFLMYAPETHMDFDLMLAKEKSVKNPVYYVQYAYVRCGAVLKKSKAQKKSFKESDISGFISPASEKLLTELVKFKEVIEDISFNYQVHHLTRYASELGRALHNFYENERILNEENKNLASFRLGLIEATQITLGILMDILGIAKPEKM